MYESLCEPWPYVWCGPLTGVDPAVTGTALLAASETLWEATGRRFGNCPVTVRPCRQDCAQFPVDTRIWSSGVIDDGWPWPTLVSGEWINLACGTCSGECSCSSTSEIILPEPVWEITNVVVDGVSIGPSGYVLYDGHRLVRVGAEWPTCQEWSVAEGVGAWSITARFGAPVPALGQQAVGVLALELARLCSGVNCGLPLLSVTRITRQGVTFEKFSPQDLLQHGFTGLFLPDQFIRTYNPGGIRDRARVYSPDVTYPRTQA